MKKILVIEDDPYIVNLYRRLFSFASYQLDTAENGQKGLEAAKKSPPDLIMLDIMMPVMNGLETLEKLKSDDSTANIPVIMLTNIDDPATLQKARQLGASDYLVKSNFESNYIMGIVNKYLN